MRQLHMSRHRARRSVSNTSAAMSTSPTWGIRCADSQPASPPTRSRAGHSVAADRRNSGGRLR